MRALLLAAHVLAAGILAGSLTAGSTAVGSLTAGGLVGSSPALAASGQAHIEVEPDAVPAGAHVHLRAQCGDEPDPARVSSRAFRDLRLEPVPGSAVMTEDVVVYDSARPGTYQVRLRCADGTSETTDLYVLDMARPTLGPATGGGGNAGPGLAGPLLVGSAGLLVLGYGTRLLVRWHRRSA